RGKNQGQAHASFYAPKLEAYIPRVDLHVQKPVKEFGAFMAEWRSSFRKALPDAAFTTDELTSVRGRTAQFLEVTFTDGGIPMKSMWMAVGRDDRLYLLGWACTAAFYDRFARTVEAMFRSLRIYAEPEVPLEARKNYDRLYGEAEGLYRAQKYAEAAEKFRECAVIMPDYPEIHATVGTALMRKRDYPGAEAAFRRAMELDPEDASHFYNYGATLLQQGKYDPAIEALRKAAQVEPWMEPAWTNLGAALLAKKDAKAAAEALEKAIAADPESVAAHYNLGCAYEALDKRDKAAAQFREALKLDPKHEGARRGLNRVT
ncbi:MAG TPA: tetratricopeptide repeat protein, partial [Planctomycetota bacterium]